MECMLITESHSSEICLVTTLNRLMSVPSVHGTESTFQAQNRLHCPADWLKNECNNNRGTQILNPPSENPGNPKTSSPLVFDFRFPSIGLWPRHITHWHKLPSWGRGNHLIWCTHLSYSRSLGSLLIYGLTRVQWLSIGPSKVSKRLGAFLVWRAGFRNDVIRYKSYDGQSPKKVIWRLVSHMPIWQKNRRREKPMNEIPASSTVNVNLQLTRYLLNKKHSPVSPSHSTGILLTGDDAFFCKECVTRLAAETVPTTTSYLPLPV